MINNIRFAIFVQFDLITAHQRNAYRAAEWLTAVGAYGGGDATCGRSPWLFVLETEVEWWVPMHSCYVYMCVRREWNTPDKNALYTHTFRKGSSKPFLKQVVSNFSVCVCCQREAGWDHLSAGEGMWTVLGNNTPYREPHITNTL